MSSVLLDDPQEEEIVETFPQSVEEAEHRLHAAAVRVASNYTGVCLRLGKPGRQKCLKDTQVDQAVATFKAKRRSVSMSKKLLNPDDPAVKQLMAVYARIDDVFKDPTQTLPCPKEPGVRLLRRDCVDTFDEKMEQATSLLPAAAAELKEAMPRIIEWAKDDLGTLYNPDDYLFDPVVQCYARWDYPETVSATSSLMDLSIKAYERQCRQVYELSVAACAAKEREMAESALSMIDGLCEALSTNEDGKRKIFRNDTVTKIFDAIDHASVQLDENGIGEGQLQTAFAKLRNAVGGRRESLPETLRNGDEQYRQQFKERLLTVGQAIAGMSEVKPRRALLRKRVHNDVLKKALA